MIALSTIFKYLSLIGSFAVVGSLLAMGFLLLDSHGKLSTSAKKLRTMLWISSLTWSIGSIGVILFTLATILDQPLSFALDSTVLRSFLTQITLGQYLLFQTLVALVITFAATDKEALEAFQTVAKLEGILAALEPSHALAHVLKIAPKMKKDQLLVVNVCGRGDKDIFTIANALGMNI